MVTTPTLGLDVAAAGAMPADEVLAALGSTTDGLPDAEANRRRAEVGAQRRPDAPDPGYCRCWGGNCDVVDLRLGEVVPADLRLLGADGLECEESVLTRESLPVVTSVAPVAAGTALAELTSCALMGTVVHAGSGTGGRGGHRRTGGVRPGRA
jgi:hypothetical protein